MGRSNLYAFPYTAPNEPYSGINWFPVSGTDGKHRKLKLNTFSLKGTEIERVTTLHVLKNKSVGKTVAIKLQSST